MRRKTRMQFTANPITLINDLLFCPERTSIKSGVYVGQFAITKLGTLFFIYLRFYRANQSVLEAKKQY